jgi:hypothetical protein
MNNGHDRRKLQTQGALENQRTWVALVLVWSGGLVLWLALAALLLQS